MTFLLFYNIILHLENKHYKILSTYTVAYIVSQNLHQFPNPDVQKDNPVGKRDSIVSTITTEIEILCECGFTSEDIDTTVSGFKCSDDPGAVIFRGLIRSGKNQATEIVSYLQQWVSGGVSISITGLILEVDPMCTVLVQSLSDPECGVDSPTGSADATSEDGSSTAVIVGGVVAVVVFIIIVAVVVVAITVWVSWRKRDIYRR